MIEKQQTHRAQYARTSMNNKLVVPATLVTIAVPAVPAATTVPLVPITLPHSTQPALTASDISCDAMCACVWYLVSCDAVWYGILFHDSAHGTRRQDGATYYRIRVPQDNAAQQLTTSHHGIRQDDTPYHNKARRQRITTTHHPPAPRSHIHTHHSRRHHTASHETHTTSHHRVTQWMEVR